MATISLAIQKGGSGKTTTAINLAAALQQQGRRVLLVDLDPQSNLTQALGVLEEPEPNIYHLLHEEAEGKDPELRNIIVETRSGLNLIPASLELANAEVELINVYGREQLFLEMLRPLKPDYDFIFIDCPPSIAVLTVNALIASDFILMPLQAEFLPLKGVRSFLRAIEPIRKKLNKNLELLGIVLTKYDYRKTMHRQVLETLQREFDGKVFDTYIRTNIALAQAQEQGLDIFSFQKKSNGALDYQALAEEFVKRLPRV